MKVFLACIQMLVIGDHEFEVVDDVGLEVIHLQ